MANSSNWNDSEELEIGGVISITRKEGSFNLKINGENDLILLNVNIWYSNIDNRMLLPIQTIQSTGLICLCSFFENLSEFLEIHQKTLTGIIVLSTLFDINLTLDELNYVDKDLFIKTFYKKTIVNNFLDLYNLLNTLFDIYLQRHA